MNVDNTKRHCYSTCPRKYYYEHIKNLRPIYGSSALRYGITWHCIIENYYNTIKEHGWSAQPEAITNAVLAGKKIWESESAKFSFYPDYRTLENCLSAFMGYLDNYKDDSNFLKIIDVETKFEIQLTPEIEFVGKIDGTIELNSAMWLMENKTTGMPIDKQLKTLLRNPQLIGYFFAGRELYSPTHIEGVLIPMLHTSATKSKVTSNYGKPRFDYRRSPQIFTDDDIQIWKQSFIWTANQLINSIEHNFWPMQLDSCYYFGACGFTALCEQGNIPLADINTSNYLTVEHWNVLKEN